MASGDRHLQTRNDFMRLKRFGRRLRFEPLETRRLLATFTVTNTLDDGAGSLRQAIIDANAALDFGDGAFDPVGIVFQIPLTDPNFVDVDSLLPGGDAEPDAWRIQPLSELPSLSNPTTGISLDGRTQTAFGGNLNPLGPEIVLDGNGLVASGLVLATNNHFIIGLNIQRFGQAGMAIIGGDTNAIVSSYIGTDATGTLAAGNGLSGVSLSGGASGNFVDKNLISGNLQHGIAIEDVGTDANEVSGNFIGTDALGTAKLANGQRGISVFDGAQSNRIGTNADGFMDGVESNVISGNTESGVVFSGTGTSNNVVAGNFLGTDPSGTIDLGNLLRGVSIFGGASFNIIGGTSPAARNIISGNDSNGVILSGAGTTNNVVIGNLIGTDATGNAALANTAAGILIELGASNNRIGTNGDGTSDALEGNLISGNAAAGVRIDASSLNVVAGNRIGINTLGTAALPNLMQGVNLTGGSKQNRIGTNGDGVSDAAEANVLSGNIFVGVGLGGVGTNNNVVAGNFIGTNSTGTAAIGNQGRGVDINSGAQHNLIGTNADGSNDSAEANVISGNGGAGIGMNGANSSFNVVAGNTIGTTAGGLAALGNEEGGIVLFNAATSNRIGGSTPSARNIISGNQTSGIRITGAGTNNNLVAGNYVGVDATGAAALPNTAEGILVDGGLSGNVIGASGVGLAEVAERNIISGNGTTGVRFFGGSANVVAGNFIGTNAAGTAAIGNGAHGVTLSAAATNNRIGTNGDGISDSDERNVISGNVNRGILISDDGTNSNVVAGNFIGVNATATAAIANGVDGVLIQTAAKSNRIGTNGDGQGDAAERNIISGNLGAGVNIVGAGTSLNVVAGNSIGTDASGTADLGNNSDGVRIHSAAQDNLVGGLPAVGNTIAFNNQNGVELTGSALTGNAIVGNSIYSNALFGIDLNADQITPNDDQDADEGPNRLQNTPEIDGAIVSLSTMRVRYYRADGCGQCRLPAASGFLSGRRRQPRGPDVSGRRCVYPADFLAGFKTSSLHWRRL